MITVYTITYNEALLIQFMIDHYRERFPNCRIVVYDNMSTDDTVKIALANNCEVIPFDTGGQFQDRRHMDIKNSCWKEAKTDWVLTCDLDELLDINEAELKMEENAGASIIKAEGYSMVNMEDNFDIASMKYGTRESAYDKMYLFNKRLIDEINYTAGCHGCSPRGSVVYSEKAYKLYHYIAINKILTAKKYKLYASRLSPENIENGWGNQYFMTPEGISDSFAEGRQAAVKVR